MARALRRAARGRSRSSALGLAALALALGGCFRAPATGSARALATWRDLQEDAPRVPAGATPADAPAPGDALTAEQAYALALARNPELAVHDARADVAAAQIGAARQLENPELRLTQFRIDDAIQRTPSLNAALRLPIPRPGSVRARVQAAEQGAAGARALADEARRQLRARVYKLYARLALLRADLSQVARADALRGERVRLLQARVERAAATRLDLALADVALAEAADDGARLRDELAQVEAELQQLTGAGPQVRFRADEAELRLIDVGPRREALIERALAGRPELRAAQTRTIQAEAGAYLARGAAWPWLNWAQVGYSAGPGATASSWALGVALEVPVFSWNRGAIRGAQALVRQRELEERAGVAAVAHEVAQAHARVERTAARVRELEAGLLPKLEAAGREADAALAAGALDPLQAADLEARKISALRLRLAALYEHRAAVIDLEAAVGAALHDR